MIFENVSRNYLRLLRATEHFCTQPHSYYREIFRNEVYQAARERNVVIDLGAAYGLFSLYVYDQAKVIYAIEPASSVFNTLESNIERYKLTKIKPFKLAIAGSKGKRTLVGGSGPSKNYSLFFKKGNRKEIVPTMTLASFMKKNKIKRVDILKIDVEGAEEEIFAAKDFPKVASKIHFIIGETHFDNWKDQNSNWGKVKKLLEKNGFTTAWNKTTRVFTASKT